MPGHKTSCQTTVYSCLRSAGVYTLLSEHICADIPLPEGLMPPMDETDDLREELEAQNKGPDKWVELGLHTVQ